jgi:hypothetical protein
MKFRNAARGFHSGAKTSFSGWRFSARGFEQKNAPADKSLKQPKLPARKSQSPNWATEFVRGKRDKREKLPGVTFEAFGVVNFFTPSCPLSRFPDGAR